MSECESEELLRKLVGQITASSDLTKEYAEKMAKSLIDEVLNGGDSYNWDDSVCRGDMGVANFFISPEDLEKRDFSHVLFYWDCC